MGFYIQFSKKSSERAVASSCALLLLFRVKQCSREDLPHRRTVDLDHFDLVIERGPFSPGLLLFFVVFGGDEMRGANWRWLLLGGHREEPHLPRGFFGRPLRFPYIDYYPLSSWSKIQGMFTVEIFLWGAVFAAGSVFVSSVVLCGCTGCAALGGPFFVEAGGAFSA